MAAMKKMPKGMEMEAPAKKGKKDDMKKDVSKMKGMPKGKMGASKKPMMYD